MRVNEQPDTLRRGHRIAKGTLNAESPKITGAVVQGLAIIILHTI